MKAGIRLGVAVAWLVFAGCDSSSVPLDELDHALAQAYCESLAKCATRGLAWRSAPSGTMIDGVLAMHPGTVACADGLASSAYHTRERFQASVTAGRIEYDGAAAQKCVDALASSCEDPFTGPSDTFPVCDGMFVGQVPLEGACVLDEECAGDARCDFSTAGTCGKCVRLAALGEACQGSSECVQHVPNGYSSCISTASNPVMHCVAISWTENVPAGGTCGIGFDAATDPTTDASCAPGLYCRSSPGGIECSPPLAVGEACDPIRDACEGDAICAPNAGSTGNSCQAVTLETAVGAPCDEAHLRFCNPLDRLACVGGACALVGSGVVGQPCRLDLRADCNAGLYCDSTTPSAFGGLCATMLANGTPCASYKACTSGYCDYMTNPAMPVCADYMAITCG